MQIRERITCSVLALVFILGLGTYVSPQSVRADEYSSFVWHESKQASTKPNQPSISGDQESVQISYGANSELTDIVRYSNLTVGKTYIIEGRLYELIVDEKGNKIVNDTGIASSQSFTIPDSPRAKAGIDGGTKVNFGVVLQRFSIEDLEVMRGKDYVIFEMLKDGDDIILQLDSQNDSSRYVKIPTFSSSIVSAENGTKVSLANSSSSAKARISYNNLIPGKNYYCHIRLTKQAEAGAVFTLGEDDYKFVPTKSKGYFERTIPFFIMPKSGDGVQLSYDISMDDENTDNNSEVLIYRMNDNSIEENKLYVAGFGLALNDIKTGNSISEYSKSATSRMNLSFVNLPYGEFKITTSLFDASTNKILKGSDGKPCRKTETFFPVIKNSSYSTDFKFDSTVLAGHQLYSKIMVSVGNKVIYSADSKTANNRIYIASVASKDLAFTNGLHKAVLSNSYQSVKDLISYKNLLTGKKYTVESSLINAKTKKQVGYPVRSMFTPFNTSGEFTNTVGSLAFGGLLGSFLHSRVNLYMDDILIASSRNVPKNYAGITIPKPTPTPKPKPKKASKPKTTKKTASHKTKKRSIKKKRARRSATVYWTRTGKCYHRLSSCPATRTVYYGSLSEALSMGLRPCKKCC